MSQQQTSQQSRRRQPRVIASRVVIQRRRAAQPQRAQRRRVNTDDFSLVFQDITRTITTAINRPVVLIVLLCVTALIYTHHDDFSSGVIGQWLAQSGSAQESHLIKWLSENQMKFLGLLAFLPTVIDSPKTVQGMLAVGSVLWVMLIPESSVYEYIIQSFCIHTYFRVRLQKSRTVIILFVIFAYFAGFWTVMKRPVQSVPASGGATPRPPLYNRPEPRPQRVANGGSG
nr:hypothetical protein 4 [ssRNA positive-strand virus sp.]